MERKKIRDLTEEDFNKIVDGFTILVDAPNTFKFIVKGVEDGNFNGQDNWSYVKKNYFF